MTIQEPIHDPTQELPQESVQQPAFNEHAEAWQRVSPKYAIADLIMNLVGWVVVTAVLVTVFTINGWDWWSITLVSAASLVILISSFFAFRRVKAIGYMMREDDFIFRRGIMFERIIAVPYGRLQLVDVTRGPLLRALGLANLKFVTASAATGVQLPGLTVEAAEQLRDELVQLAETRRSGL